MFLYYAYEFLSHSQKCVLLGHRNQMTFGHKIIMSSSLSPIGYLFLIWRNSPKAFLRYFIHKNVTDEQMWHDISVENQEILFLFLYKFHHVPRCNSQFDLCKLETQWDTYCTSHQTHHYYSYDQMQSVLFVSFFRLPFILSRGPYCTKYFREQKVNIKL